jgi:hypothetical protein
VEWCNRLHFNVRLVNAVLDYTESVQKRTSGFVPDPATQARDRNDQATRLLDTLRLHSILYSFRDFLSQLSPTVLVDVLNEPTLTAGGAVGDRSPDTDHDIHVLRR